MQFNIATTISFVSAAACLAVSVVSASVARSQASRYFRCAAIATFLGAAFCLADALIASDISRPVAVWAARVSVAAGAMHAAAWLRFLSSWASRPLGRLERATILTCTIAAVAMLVPGVGTFDEVARREIPSLRIVYLEPRPTLIGALCMLVAYAAHVVTARQAWLASRTRAQARLTVAAFGALFVLGLGDLLAAWGAVNFPYLTDVALAVAALGMGAVMVQDSIETSRALQLRSTELAQARVDLAEQERLAAVGQLAAVVAHEVRNPLAIIYNALAALRRDHPDQRGELLDIVDQEARRLTRLVDTLLDAVRPFELTYASMPVEDVVHGAVALATGARGTEGAEVEVAPVQGELIECDAILLEQALSNLVSNALDARGRRSPVHVSAALDQADGSVVFEVRDDGDGVPSDLQDKLFAPFFTTRATGTGLGLTLVKRIAEAHGGGVEHSVPASGGARFVMRVPVRASAPRQAAAAPPSA